GTGSPAEHGVTVAEAAFGDLQALGSATGSTVEQNVGADRITEAGTQRTFEASLCLGTGVVALDAVVADVAFGTDDEVVHLVIVADKGAAEEAIGADRVARLLHAATEAVAEVNTGIRTGPGSHGKFGDRGRCRRLFHHHVGGEC